MVAPAAGGGAEVGGGGADDGDEFIGVGNVEEYTELL